MEREKRERKFIRRFHGVRGGYRRMVLVWVLGEGVYS